MTVLCWNTTWISIHSSDCNFFNFILHPRVFFNQGLKILIIISKCAVDHSRQLALIG